MNLLPRSVRKFLFEMREFFYDHILGFPEDQAIDLRVWPEASYMDPFEFHEFRKENRDKREGMKQ